LELLGLKSGKVLVFLFSLGDNDYLISLAGSDIPCTPQGPAVSSLSFLSILGGFFLKSCLALIFTASVSNLKCVLCLKTCLSSETPWKYVFQAVLKVRGSPTDVLYFFQSVIV